jgi:hypothetical protein
MLKEVWMHPATLLDLQHKKSQDFVITQDGIGLYKGCTIRTHASMPEGLVSSEPTPFVREMEARKRALRAKGSTGVLNSSSREG